MSAYEDLIPDNSVSGSYDDLIPGAKIPHPENILQRVAKAFRGRKEDMASLLEISPEELDAQTTRNREYIFPMIGQIAGSEFGGVGATTGAMVGQGVNQIIKAIPGQKFLPQEKPSLEKVGKEGIMTGAVEGVTRGAGKLFFKRQIAQKALREGVGKELSLAKDKVSEVSINNPMEFSIHINDLREPINNGLLKNKIAAFTPVGERLRYLKDHLDEIAKSGRDYLTGHELIQIDDALKDVTQYPKFIKGAVKQQRFRSPQINEVAQGVRGFVSDKIEELGVKAGITNYPNLNKSVHKLLKHSPDLDPTKWAGGFGTRLVTAGAVGAATHNPLIAAATYVAEKNLQSPEFRNTAFKVAENPFARFMGKGVKISATNTAREVA